MIMFMQRVRDFFARREAMLKLWWIHRAGGLSLRKAMWRSKIMSEYTKNPFRRLLRKLLVWQNRRRQMKLLKKFMNRRIISCTIAEPRAWKEISEDGTVEVPFSLSLS